MRLAARCACRLRRPRTWVDSQGETSMNDRQRALAPSTNRRRLLAGGTAVAAIHGLSLTAAGAEPSRSTTQRAATPHQERQPMSTFTTKDGTHIYYKDWGSGPIVSFSHGWPLCSDAWDSQMLFLAENGFRVVAHDRRGHGRSSQAWSGNDMNGYADDLAALIEALDLTDVTMVGHSTGGGEVARYIGRHGTERVAAAVLIGAVPSVMVKSAANPDGIPIEVIDGLRSGVAKDRSQFWKDFAIMFYGANRPGAKVSQGMLDQFWLWSM